MTALGGRDNVFKAFQGDPQIAAMYQQRAAMNAAMAQGGKRHFAPGPSQIGNLPGNHLHFPAPRTSPQQQPRLVALRGDAAATRARRLLASLSPDARASRSR